MQYTVKMEVRDGSLDGRAQARAVATLLRGLVDQLDDGTPLNEISVADMRGRATVEPGNPPGLLLIRVADGEVADVLADGAVAPSVHVLTRGAGQDSGDLVLVPGTAEPAALRQASVRVAPDEIQSIVTAPAVASEDEQPGELVLS